MKFTIPVLTVAISASHLIGCRTTTDTVPESIIKAEFGENGVPVDWGQLHVDREGQVTPEAMLANSAAVRLNEAAILPQLIAGFPRTTTIVDAVVAVPLKVLSSSLQPFGDGQANASVTWVGWPSHLHDVPVIASMLFLLDGEQTHRAYIVETSKDLIAARFGGTPPPDIYMEISTENREPVWLKMVFDEARNVYRVLMVPAYLMGALQPSNLFPAHVAEVPPWLNEQTNPFAWGKVRVRFSHNDISHNEYWPLLFRFPSQPVEAAARSLSISHQAFASGDKIGAPPYLPQQNAHAEEQLATWYRSNSQLAAFYPDGDGVHHHFPADGQGHEHQTATGGVDTYVRNEKPGGTEVLYTCFDARNPQNEQQWGVPSGAGWHSIGHPTNAETIINSFEPTGIFAGWAVRTPYPFSQPSPYEAKDVATFRVLRKDEVLTTLQGHFHWYAVDASRKICTVIWKHGCQLQSDQNLGCQP